MPFVYIYSPSDFVGGLPDEQGAQAAGTGPFTLTLVPGATPTAVEIADDDNNFDEVDGTQSLASAIDLDGVNYAAGTTVHSAYDLINTGTGHKVTSLHFGGDGYQQGAVQGLISTVELAPGSSYTFNVERTSYRQANPYNEYVACFVEGTRIRTRRGLRPVEQLQPGDEVELAGDRVAQVRAVLSRTLTSADLEHNPKLLPVRIMAHALGNGLPTRDLCVSPQHRIVVKSVIAKRMFGEEEVFVSARKLTALPGIFADCSFDQVTYYHVVLDNHEVMFAEEVPTESFYLGKMAIRSLTDQGREELRAIFPELETKGFGVRSARLIPQHRRQKRLVARHSLNAKPLIAAQVA